MSPLEALAADQKLAAIVARCREELRGHSCGSHSLAVAILGLADAAAVVAASEPERLPPKVHIHPNFPEP